MPSSAGHIEPLCEGIPVGPSRIVPLQNSKLFIIFVAISVLASPIPIGYASRKDDQSR